MDRLTPEHRSANMSRIRGKDTKPEWAVRRLLHRLGYRFRLHWKAAPGRPDVAFPGRRRIIFVHGCYWHQHPGCHLATMPSTRREFWEAKFESNRARDLRVLARAEAEGWQALVVWECETREPATLATRLVDFLGPVRMDREMAGADSLKSAPGSDRR